MVSRITYCTLTKKAFKITVRSIVANGYVPITTEPNNGYAMTTSISLFLQNILNEEITC